MSLSVCNGAERAPIVVRITTMAVIHQQRYSFASGALQKPLTKCVTTSGTFSVCKAFRFQNLEILLLSFDRDIGWQAIRDFYRPLSLWKQAPDELIFCL